MPKHRTLSLRKLVNAVSRGLFEEYFAQLDVHRRPSAWAYINPDASGTIREDFGSINENTNLLGDCYLLA